VLCEHPVEVFRVVVPEAQELRAREERAVQLAGVAELVGENAVPAPEQGGDDPRVRLVAGIEDQGRLASLEHRHAVLELVVDRQVPAHQAGRPGPDAVAVERLPRRRDQRGVGRQPEVIVGGEVDVFPAVPHREGGRAAGRRDEPPQQLPRAPPHDDSLRGKRGPLGRGKKGTVPALWDGHAAERIADILLRQENPEPGRSFFND